MPPCAVAAPGARILEQRSVGAFSAIDVSGPFDIVVQAQGAPGVALSGERDQLKQVETFVRGDTLVLRPSGRVNWTFGYTPQRRHVSISVGAPQLARMRMSGSGDVTLEQVAGERIALALDGPGDLQASGQVRELALRVSGSGVARLERLHAANVDLTMSGPGNVDLAGIDGELQARLSGSGQLDGRRLHAGRADLAVSGPGTAQMHVSGEDALHPARGALLVVHRRGSSQMPD